ncbi:noggin-2-like isoform X2 [Ruditapes philippinarum]|nr:noggin-2-like isoform X2 [Ruditapes philippinarum]
MKISNRIIFPLVMLIQMISGIYIQDSRMDSLVKKRFQFPVMRHYLPHGKHLKRKRLLRKLGQDFDSEWMSIETPKKSNHVPDTFLQQGNKIEDGLLKLRLGHLIEFYSHDMNLSNQSKEDIKSFMQNMARCEINFEWEDLGNLFWPRNIKSGECASNSPCSWPSGMLCQASERKTLHLLHWRCIRQKNKKSNTERKTMKENRTNELRRIRQRRTRSIGGVMGRELKCRWKKIPYEVTTKCGCSC